ncbi:MAG: putative manganese transporter, partial [Bacilli bacterium]
MFDVFLESLFDSLKIFGLALAIYVSLSFFESKVIKFLESKKKIAPLLGSLCGVIPQCGISVVASDLYVKHHLTMGTLVAVFIACSDEALPILFSNFTGTWYMVFPLIAIKIIGGFLFGYIVDAIFYKRRREVVEHAKTCDGETIDVTGCCGHELEEGKESNPWHAHLWHPLIHSIKIFVYSFIILFGFGLIMYYFEDSM